ncbi:hypothetical protein [Caulobacter sp. AP07]|uniref:hypothetical protein n=1 Tax=Caulobacter sp. AP07 TaxID=1144304 RepID=UPI0002ECD5DC|nr:hypothetical protein [Caulobacter sp. AP07]
MTAVAPKTAGLAKANAAQKESRTRARAWRRGTFGVIIVGIGLVSGVAAIAINTHLHLIETKTKPDCEIP